MEQEKKAILAGTMNAVLRKKLQDRILELIDAPSDRTDLNLVKYLELAREQGFSDEAALLERIIYEFGETAIESKRLDCEEKIERQKKEMRLEDYLSQPGNLNQVEQGLEYVDRQETIKSGRRDIVAKGAEGRDVTVELKTSDDDHDKLACQLMKYLNEKEKTRAILIAPHIDPALFFTLKHYVDSGRLTFYEVSGDEGNYSFRAVNKDEFKEDEINKAIDRVNRKREKKTKKPEDRENLESALIKIIHTRRRATQKIKSQCNGIENEEADLKKRYLERRNLDHPMLKNPALIDQITASEKQNLEALIKCRTLERMIDLYRQRESEMPDYRNDTSKIALELDKVDITIGEFIAENPNLEKIVNNCLGELPFEAALITTGRVNNKLSNNIYEILKALKRKQGIIRGRISSTENHPSLKRLRHKLIQAMQEKTSPILTALHYALSLYEEKLLNEDLKCTIKKTENLAKISEHMAMSFLISSVSPKDYLTFAKIADCNSAPVPINLGVIDKLAEENNKRYAEIVRRIVDFAYQPAPTQTSVPVGEPIIRGTFHTSPLVEAINHQNRWCLSPDSEKRIQYFAEDALKYGANYDALTDSFLRFNLGKRLSKRRELPADVQLRNFFDDVTLKYIIKGKVPEPKDLEKIYTQNCMDKNGQNGKNGA